MRPLPRAAVRVGPSTRPPGGPGASPMAACLPPRGPGVSDRHGPALFRGFYHRRKAQTRPRVPFPVLAETGGGHGAQGWQSRCGARPGRPQSRLTRPSPSAWGTWGESGSRGRPGPSGPPDLRPAANPDGKGPVWGRTGPRAKSHLCGRGAPARAGGAGRGRGGAAACGRSVCEPAVAAGPTHRRGCGGRQERRRGQPRGEGGECVLVLVCVLVCVLVLVELRPQQSPRAQRGAGPLGTLDQKARVQLLPEQLAIYERKRERQRGTSAAAPGGARRIVTWHSRLRQATPWWPLATCGPQGGGKRGACDQVPIRIPA